MKKIGISKIKFISFLLLALMASCNTDDYQEPDGPYPSEETVGTEGMKNLLKAYNEGKEISNILYLSPSMDLDGRWLISFTDGTSINIFGNPDGATPYLRVNNEGFWSVAYNGTTFKDIKDNKGEKIKALKEGIDPDDPFQMESDILCLAPEADGTGKLSFNAYDFSEPSYIIEKIETEVALPVSAILTGMVQNDYTGSISFYIQGDGPLHFSYKNRWPYSFGVINLDETLFQMPGDSASIEFFVSPVDIDFKLDTDNPVLNLTLAYINGEEAKNYSSYPVEIKRIEKAEDEKGNIIPGRYIAFLEDRGDNLFTYDEPALLSLEYLGVERERLSISSQIFNLKYDSESPLIIESEVPVIKIKSPKAITSKDDWTDDCEIEFLNAGDYNKKYTKVQMKGRGNSTWDAPKKPYAIKLDKKEEMLGFPKHKRWVLLANYHDHTNLRNEIAFYMGRMSEKQGSGLKYNPRTSFVRLFFNEEFKGLYQLTEQLKVDENRVNVGDGFLLEIDFRAIEEAGTIYFRIPHINNYISVKDPDIENQSDLDYIKEYMKKADEALFSENFTDAQEGYRKYIDVSSFIDWYLVNEITKNADSNFWTSCYMNFSRGGKLNMGPLWDFDLAAGNYKDFGDWWYTQWINDPKDFHIKNVEWYDRMFRDPEFVKELKQRFQYYYDRQPEIYEEIERQRELILPLIEENEKIWFFFAKPYDKTFSTQEFNRNCNELKDWLQQRFAWLKKAYDNL